MLVGSSMGGWIARSWRGGSRGGIHSPVGVAAAPDFTEDAMWAGMECSGAGRSLLAGGGIQVAERVLGDANYVITRRLIEDGRRHLVCGCPFIYDFVVPPVMAPPTGTFDLSVALRLFAHDHVAGHPSQHREGRRYRFSVLENLEPDRTVEETL